MLDLVPRLCSILMMHGTELSPIIAKKTRLILPTEGGHTSVCPSRLILG